MTVVLGRNGTGKTTLLRIAAGHLRPDYGTIRFAGKTLHPARLHQLARAGLFYLPDRAILSPSFSVRQQLTLFSARFGGNEIEATAQAFGIGEVLDCRPFELSGGELRRAELCLAEVCAPACLIADEPLRGIDPKDSELLLQRMRGLAQRGCAVVLSGHDAKAIVAPEDHVVWVTAGTTSTFASGSDALRDERFRKEYLTGAWSERTS